MLSLKESDFSEAFFFLPYLLSDKGHTENHVSLESDLEMVKDHGLCLHDHPKERIHTDV